MEEVPERPRRRMRSYKIQEVIKRRQIILVQVVKEERGSKGAALTTYLSLAGRYTVLMPNTGRGGGISRKITQPQDSKRLKAIAHELEVPEGMGLIIRTAGAARTKQEIKRDFEYEIRLWENVRDLTLTLDRALPRLRGRQPDQALDPRPLLQGHRRDRGGRRDGAQGSLDFMRMLSPSQTKHVIKYEEPEPLFDRYQIERQLNAMFSPYVTLRSGGYLVINQTEALVSIDVNSGKATREFSIEETALNTNLEASDEIARQLKLQGPRRPDRHRLHRHGGAAQQPQGREPPQGRVAPRPRPHPGRPHQPFRPAWKCRASACAPACSKAPPRSARTARAPASSAPWSRWRWRCCARSRTSCCAMPATR